MSCRESSSVGARTMCVMMPVSARSRPRSLVSSAPRSRTTRSRQARKSPSLEPKYRLMRATFTPASPAMSRTVVARYPSKANRRRAACTSRSRVAAASLLMERSLAVLTGM